ncbi:hypothetical protein N4T77_19355 [Clostridium sp. CX1]|uniref:DUF1450 domain-containing protein n=1 Tax=Clostridium tanneri TaxID=3037988 RepID=A0ABU4JYH5_9CLOT|nr:MULTISPECIES: hypothetical protein [unclassified Clostridium]MCT8978743.1 hypothetical protein [Clostridium sp. CX1]MDW8802958.1 hypothetical protein [Clostridium sp. A1-XYC3]
MISVQQKMIVAENCVEYKPKVFITAMSFISQGCESCRSYIDGKCTKELFTVIEEKIRMN